MFNKIKAIKDIRSQAKVLEKALEAVQVTGESRGLSLTLNGKQELVRVHIPDELERDRIADAFKEAFSRAIHDLQKEVQRVMKETGGLPDMSQLGL